jgi:hypothetical protein
MLYQLSYAGTNFSDFIIQAKLACAIEAFYQSPASSCPGAGRDEAVTRPRSEEAIGARLIPVEAIGV